MSFNRFAGRLAVTCALGCFFVGLVAVAWRVKSRGDALRASGRAEVVSQVAAVQAQLSQTLAAAEALGLLARQNGGTVPNFSRAAQELFGVFPGLDSVQLEPNGIISDVVPRLGHERMIGLNVMSEPAYRAGASAAIQHHSLAVSGPLLLPGADMGIVALVPVYQRGRDNRETFWGFTAASMRLSRALDAARVAELPKCGFDYLCYVPGTAQQQAVTITGYGTVPVADALQQPLRIQNTDVLHIAVYPHGGWFNKSKFGLDLFAVILVSALVGLLVNALESRQAVEQSLAEATQQAARGSNERQRSEDDLRAAKDAAAAAQARQELEQTRASLQQAQKTVVDLQSRLQAATQAEKDNAATVLTRLQQDQTAIADLHAQLEAATRSARETSEAGAAKLQELEAANQQLTARLAAAAHYEARVAELTESLQQAEAESVQLRQNRAEAGGVPVEVAALESAPAEKPRPERRKKPRPAEELAPESVVTEPAAVSETILEYRAEPAPSETAEIKHNGAEEEPAPMPEPASPVAMVETALAGPVPENGEPAETTVADVEPSAPEKAAKSARRKKVRRVDQMDLFGAAPAGDEGSRQTVAETPVEEPRPETASLFEPEPSVEKASTEPSAVATSTASVAEKTFTTTISVEEDAAPEPAADPKAQAKALRRFVEEHARTPERIRDDLVLGDSAAAQKTIETLKAAADEAGAKEVHDAAAALARTLQASADPAAAEFLWADLQKAVHDLAGEVKPAPKARAEKPKPARPLPPPPPLDIAELRSAVGMIVPLLMDQDPGASDCLKDNRDTFRSTFSPEAYVEFEEAVKGNDCATALEQLRKATRKHGISV